MEATQVNILDALTELLFDPDLGASGKRRQSDAVPVEDRTFARGGVLYRSRRIQTVEELEAARVRFRASINRTDY
jgi:hypothetical protein